MADRGPALRPGAIRRRGVDPDRRLDEATMRITCPTCETSYGLADGALGASGRKVRCTRCGTTWHARPFDEGPRDEAGAEAEWAALDVAEAASTAPPVAAGPAEAAWKAALTGEDAPPQAAGPDAERALPDGGPGTALATVEPERTEEPPATEAPTIEAEPAGFDRSRGRARAPTRRPARTGRNFGTRVLSAFVVTVAAGTVAGLLAGSLFAREALVRRFPDLAGLYALVGLEVNLRGLVFENLNTFREMDGATPVLVVDGVVRNVSETDRPVPRLRFGLLSTSGREVYAWTMDPAENRIDPDGTMRFRSRLPAPPEAATDVEVRFTDRGGP